MGESFYPVFLNGDVSTQKIFNLAAIMEDDTLFFDFVYEVIREKMIIGSNEYKPSDVNIFLRINSCRVKRQPDGRMLH